MTVERLEINRRSFLQKSAAGVTGLVIGFYLPEAETALAETAPVPAGSFAPNAWIRISPDDVVTIVIDRTEQGQGVMTSIPMLIAEDLEADWKKIRTEFAPADQAYFNPAMATQGTGGSTTIRGSWTSLRKAGATAREMLIDAAARRWNIDKSACRAENNTVINTTTGERASYGSLCAAAAKLSPPKEVTLKDPKTFRLVGRPTKRLDTPDKVSGRAGYGIDVQVPGMLYASVARCPVFGGKVASFDETKTKAMPGVREVVQISNGVAVVADSTWSAMQGCAALEVKWDEGPNAGLDSARVSQLLAEQSQQPGAIARKEGDALAALANAVTRIEADYEAPFLAHVTMEPMNCTAHVQADSCHVWVPTQYQTFTQETAMKITGFKRESVFVHTTYVGGGFGRRPEQDFVTDAVEVSKAVKAPVKVTFTREEDVQHDFYRPASHSRFVAGLGKDGSVIAWINRIACPAISIRRPDKIVNGIDKTSVEGANDIPYAIPNLLVSYQMTNFGVPVGFWRSVGHSQNTFFTESFVDELAAAARSDPYEFRRQLLANAPRYRGVLELAATKAGWGTPLPAGRFRGIAVMNGYESYVSHVVELSVSSNDQRISLHRVVCAIDCGRTVNPDTIDAQLKGATIWGLTAALKGEITLERGRVQQSNFHDYEVLRIDEAPTVETYIVPSEENAGGVGEPAAATIAPAVCNAIFAATGKRIRRLPLRSANLA